ncbi:MAG: RraA family protein [Synergistales bacterium]|nr:RraA family protein [Synergistales bacterium]
MLDPNVAKDYDEYQKAGRIWGLVPRERIKTIKFPRVPKEISDQFLEIEDLTSTVSDVLDSLGICGAVAASHLPPVIPGKRIAGTAVTLRSIPERKTPTQGYVDKEFIRMSTREVYYLSEPGDVLVADFGGDRDVSNMGGQSCTVAKSMNFCGAVVNGAVRDVPTIRKMDYPVWSCGITPITGKFRMEAIEINGPVSVHNIVVYPGDFIVADDSGICVIPFDKVEYVLKEIQKIDAEEENMRELIEEKRPISELRPLYRKRYK